MTESALQQLRDAQAALNTALDSRDAGALEAATAAVAVAVEEVRVVGGWRERQGLREDLISILHHAQTVRGRINGLADLNRRKLEKLTRLAGAPQAVSYGRSGKLA